MIIIGTVAHNLDDFQRIGKGEASCQRGLYFAPLGLRRP